MTTAGRKQARRTPAGANAAAASGRHRQSPAFTTEERLDEAISALLKVGFGMREAESAIKRWAANGSDATEVLSKARHYASLRDLTLNTIAKLELHIGLTPEEQERERRRFEEDPHAVLVMRQLDLIERARKMGDLASESRGLEALAKLRGAYKAPAKPLEDDVEDVPDLSARLDVIDNLVKRQSPVVVELPATPRVTAAMKRRGISPKKAG